MRPPVRHALQASALIAFAAVLFFAFPFTIRFLEAAAMSIRRFWWVILLLVLTGWVVLVLRQRNG